MKRMFLAPVLAFVLLAAAAAPASASTWSGLQLSGEAAKVTMFGISCPTASLCVAVGGNNTIASSTNPAGGLASWKVVYAGAGAMPTAPNSSFAGRQVRGVSCPSPQLCVGVTFEGDVYAATEPTGDAAAWTVTDIDGGGPNTHLYGVSCPTVSFCAASAGKGKIVTSTNPTGGPAAWTTTQLDASTELRGISCASTVLCVAVGDDGDGTTYDSEIVSSTAPLLGAWQQVSLPGGHGSLYGVSCPSPGLCVSGDLLGNLLVATSPGDGASAWGTTDGGGSVQITAASCVSVSRCVLVDNNADVLASADPTGGPGAWTFTNVLPYPGVDETAANAMFGVSCPSVGFCAVAANKGQIFTSGDPFAAVREPPRKRGGVKGKKRPKRPRVEIALQPHAGTEIRGRTFKARFRFFARNHVQVRGFACRLDHRPVKRCGSPKSYRVGLGRHVFRVRAIGWTGLEGPPAVARFKVCHPGPLPMCLGQHLHRGRTGATVAALRWRPHPSTAPWQWQLQGKIDTGVDAAVYDLDGFETPASTVRALHRQGRRVVCYLDVGSWESYRPDAARFPASVRGNAYEGFPDERWLDVSRFRFFARPLERRFDLCARKGFDAVEPDNLAGWEAENDTGFAITATDQLRFNRWVARQAHRRGMAVALKNDGRQAAALVGDFDFAIVEECFQYDECGLYSPFVERGKAVFAAEYELAPEQYCAAAARLGFSAIGKSYDLFARPWRPCPS